MRNIAFIALVGMSFIACSGDDKTDSGESGDTDTIGDDDDDTTTTPLSVVIDWTDDGEVPTDTDGDTLPDIGCGDSVTVTITDPLGETSWSFGMAETGSTNGWTGEDCYQGYLTYNFCHSVGVADTIPETTDCSANSVADGVTLMDAAKDPFLTYYLEDSLGTCFTWGEDITYYGPVNCTEMAR